MAHWQNRLNRSLNLVPPVLFPYCACSLDKTRVFRDRWSRETKTLGTRVWQPLSDIVMSMRGSIPVLSILRKFFRFFRMIQKPGNGVFREVKSKAKNIIVSDFYLSETCYSPRWIRKEQMTFKSSCHRLICLDWRSLETYSVQKCGTPKADELWNKRNNFTKTNGFEIVDAPQI